MSIALEFHSVFVVLCMWNFHNVYYFPFQMTFLRYVRFKINEILAYFYLEGLADK